MPWSAAQICIVVCAVTCFTTCFTMPCLALQIVYNDTSAEFLGVPLLNQLPRLDLPQLPDALKPPKNFRYAWARACALGVYMRLGGLVYGSWWCLWRLLSSCTKSWGYGLALACTGIAFEVACNRGSLWPASSGLVCMCRLSDAWSAVALCFSAKGCGVRLPRVAALISVLSA